jgi:hypothetical protein
MDECPFKSRRLPRRTRNNTTIHIPTSITLFTKDSRRVHSNTHIPLHPPTPPSCTAPTPCASRAPPPLRRSRTHRLPPPPPRVAGSLARPTLVCRIVCAEYTVSTWANWNIRRPQLPQVRSPRCLRPRPCEEALPAREDGEERHALHGARRP